MSLTYQVACWVQFNYGSALLRGIKGGDRNGKKHSQIAGDCWYRQKVNKSTSVKEKSD